MQFTHYSSEPFLGPLRSALKHDKDHKPSGFWLSVDDGEMGWADWCRAEEYELAGLACVHDVTLKGDAHILRISDPAGIDAFTAEFAGLDYDGRRNLGRVWRIDWPRVAKLYQGVVIAPYIWERRLDMVSSWYYGWDCASGCIWDASAIASIRLRQAVEQVA